ncbi:hypothetical protein GGH15_004477 [Coemansia sp. RSA 562]|nr:hypothetical protein GGH15_004477 [Coemansia sp. RSA 562]KAJ2268801.1 hypothetical protein J3F81_004556 [Coemansia sp. RSA 371]
MSAVSEKEPVGVADPAQAPEGQAPIPLAEPATTAPAPATDTPPNDDTTNKPAPQQQQEQPLTADSVPTDAKREADLQSAERDKETVEEFQYLLEKSQHLFSGLSDLPEIGSKYWQPHFQRTFEVYTKLWKFQNQHRLLLENPVHYGLKRWEVGEIASKIGQLYYRYYLRTSETNYLHEAFVFYDAIRERNYFRGELSMKNSALMIKKLRYYARFIVVCLQMNSTGMMLQLLEEVKSLVEVYATVFNPVDKMEWALVVKEMALFMQAVCGPVPVDDAGVTLPASYRLVPRRGRVEKEPKFRLQEALVVGNRPTQIKFSELTLDMYYVLQMLEREPSVNPMGAAPSEGAVSAEPSATGISESVRSPDMLESASSAVQEPNADATRSDSTEIKPKEKTEDTDRATRRPNPHKYVLYQPTVSQVLVYLANAFREIGDQGCVLLYLSSDGSRIDSETSHGYIGGIATSRRGQGDSTHDRTTDLLINTVHPADLVPFTRKPLFLIVESSCSSTYSNMPNLFNQPMLALLSPTMYPIHMNSGIYTFFLHSPLVAFCALSQITTMDAIRWAHVDRLFGEFEDCVWEFVSQVSDTRVRRFFGDDFLRQIVVRHVVCCVVLGMHREFTRKEHLPQASPELFAQIAEEAELIRKARAIIDECGVAEMYRLEESIGSPAPVTDTGLST